MSCQTAHCPNYPASAMSPPETNLRCGCGVEQTSLSEWSQWKRGEGERAREGSAEVQQGLPCAPRQNSPINFTLLQCLLPFCFKATMTGVNTKACSAPLASHHPPTHSPTRPPIHRLSLWSGFYIKGSRLTRLAVVMAGPFSADWHAHSLVTRHTRPPSAPKARQGNRPSPRRLVGRRVGPPCRDPSLWPAARCDACTLA